MEKLVINTSKTPKGYSCSCDKIPAWVVGFSGTFEEFKNYVQESIDFWLGCAKEDGEKYDAIFDGEYELQFKFEVQNLLDSYRDVISFSALEKITGINQKQLNHYAQGIKKPRKQQIERISSGLHRFAEEISAITV